MSDRQRIQILDAYKTRLWTLFNTSTGTEEKLFRACWRRQYQLVPMRPSFTVTDGGQRRGPSGDQDDVSEGRVLSVRIFFHIAENWEREAALQDWSNRIDLIDSKLRGCPGYGIENIRYADDDPFEVVLTSGETEAAWVLDHEVDYFTEIDQYDNWE